MSSVSLAFEGKKQQVQCVLHWVGSGLALAGIVFVGFRLHSYLHDLDFSRFTPLTWSFIALLSLLYGSANLLMALAWWHLLRHLGEFTTYLGSVRLYGVSQLAKYVPGNIFHLAGRQALGMAAGIQAGVLAKSTVWELGLFAITGTLSVWLILPLLLPGFTETVSVFLLLASAAFIIGILYRIAGLQSVLAFVWQMLFLMVSGAIFVLLLELIVGDKGIATQHGLIIGGAYIAAWLAGFVTPGAPAGVGVREMILLFLLKGLVTESDLLMAVLLGRLATVVGDLLFFMAASLIPARFYTFEKNHV